MAGKKWTPEDDRIFTTLWVKNVPLKFIAEVLDRTKRAILHRAYEKGLKRTDRTPDKNHKPLKMIRGNAGTVGMISELQVFIEFEKRGWKVFKPLVEGNASDCIIKHYKTGTTHKIQIKTASYRKDDDSYTCCLTTPQKKRYDNLDVDYFLCKVDRLNTYYIIPYEYSNQETKSCRVSLYPHRMKKYQYKHTRCYEEFRNDWGVIKT